MPLDPSIALGVKTPQIQSPFEAMAQLAQLQGAREQTEARRLAAEEARERKNRQARLDAAYRRVVKIGPDGRATVDFAAAGLDLDGETLLKLQETVDQGAIRAATLRTATMTADDRAAETLASLARPVATGNYHPGLYGIAVAGTVKAGAVTQAQADQLLDEAEADPTAIQRRVDSAIGRLGGEPVKPPTIGSVEDYVTRYAASVGKAPEALSPDDITTAVAQFQAANRAPATAPAAANVGSFEDYVVRRFGDAPTPEQITLARKDYNQSDDRPRITVNTGTGTQRPITQTAEANLINRLNTQWNKATTPARELAQQVTTMRSGIAAADRGDIAQGTEAVLQPFLKILDPNSVVREGEFWRLQAGQGYLARAQGIVQRLTKGGFIPLDELKKYARLAEEIATRYDDYVKAERGRIGKVAERYNIPPELVFEADGTTASPGATTTPGARPGTNPFSRK